MPRTACCRRPAGPVALLANTPCAPNCNKVLTAGGTRAALYNPAAGAGGVCL